MPFAFILLLFVSDFWPAKLAEPEPRVIFRFLVDNAIVDMSKGAPATGKTLTVSYKLDSLSAQTFPDLRRQPISMKCYVSIVRRGRRLATVLSDMTSNIPLVHNMLPGDILLVEMQEIQIKQKDGNWLSLIENAKRTYTIPLY